MKKFTSLLVLLLGLNSFAAPNPMSTGEYYPEYDCHWEPNGCINEFGEIKIDLRSSIHSKLESQGTNAKEFFGSFESNELVYSPNEFQTLLDSNKSSTEKQAQYFIPLALSKTEMIAALATTSLGLVVFSQDEKLMDFVQDNKSEVTQELDDFGYYLGRQGVVQFALGSYFLGAVFKNGKLKKLGLITVTAGLATQVITEVFKVGFGRQRPKEGAGPYSFGTDSKSFFSGHVSAAFSAATVVSHIYKESKVVPYVAYGLAGVVAYARMHAKGHYGSDVIFGALAGTLITRLAIRIHEKDDSYGGFMVSPGVDPLTGAFVVHFNYVKEQPKKKFSCKEFKDLDSRTYSRLCTEKLFKEHYNK